MQYIPISTTKYPNYKRIPITYKPIQKIMIYKFDL